MFVRLFFGRIYVATICFSVLSDLYSLPLEKAFNNFFNPFCKFQAYLSQSWYVFNDGSIRFDPSNFWQWGSTALTNDFSSGRVGKINLVGWLLNKDWARHIALSRNWNGKARNKRFDKLPFDVKQIIPLGNTINLYKKSVQKCTLWTTWELKKWQIGK